MSWCDFPEFYHETFPKARKQHRCIECRAPIEIGEKHLYYRGKWDGDFISGRQHIVCRELCMHINSDEDCCPFGGMKDAWGDIYFQRPIREEFKDIRSLMAEIKLRERKAERRTKPQEMGQQR